LVHKNVISLCVHTEKTGKVESSGTGVCCMFRVGTDCDVCRTVFHEKLSACVLGEEDGIDWRGAKVMMMAWLK